MVVGSWIVGGRIASGCLRPVSELQVICSQVFNLGLVGLGFSIFVFGLVLGTPSGIASP